MLTKTLYIHYKNVESWKILISVMDDLKATSARVYKKSKP